MANATPPEVDPEELKKAKALWHNFTVGGKYTIYATVIILILLALGFVKIF